MLSTELYTDAALASAAASDFLTAQPVRRNLLLTLLGHRIARPEPGRYWLAFDADEVVGVAMQSPTDFKGLVAADSVGAVDALANAVFAENPMLPGISGASATVSRFAGRWTELSSGAAFPAEGERLYQLSKRPPASSTAATGRYRRATADDSDVLVRWHHGFCDNIDTTPAQDVAGYVEQAISDGTTWIWDDGGPVAMAMNTRPIAGGSRIRHVYTPPEQRGNGYGSAITAGATLEALGAGASHCLLYTQLANATSNGIYRNIGYEAIEERLTYRFAT